MAGSNGATPRAVLGGAALIAVAVYFGLRSRPVVVVAPTTVAAGSSLPAEGNTPPHPPPSPVAPVNAAASTAPPLSTVTGALLMQGAPSPAGLSDVDRDVLAALEAQRAMLVQQCWTPAISGAPKPEPASYELDLAFDESGHEIARGLSAGKGAREGLTRCLNVRSPSLDIPPRGARAHAHVRFTLP